MNGVRELSPRRVGLAILIIAGLALVVAVVVAGAARPVAATGTLEQCLGGWPVVRFDGDDWKAALPDGLGLNAPRQIPVAAWPSGMRFDETAGALLDTDGKAVFHTGDRVRVAGTVVRTQGDPAPCFYTVGVRVETIAAP